MMMFKNVPLLVTILFFFSNNVALAQIIPDRSLPKNSTVINNQNTILINNGTQAGQNLFHSFKKFSLQNGQTAIFNNSLDIQNIFSRVTGNSVSQINGLLNTQGTANLFLLNPNGIVFGENGAIAVGGSFFATTADKVFFANGFEFNTTINSPTEILTMSRPIGMGLNNPRQIIIKGAGHELKTSENPLVGAAVTIMGGGESTFGLRTNPNQTLALIGGEIIIDGGIITAFSGQIEVSSIKNGLIRFKKNNNKTNFNYQNISQFKNIFLENQALLDATHNSSGEININAKNLYICNGSIILNSNFGSGTNSSINIKTTNLTNIEGISNFNKFNPLELNNNNIIRGIYSQNFSTGKGPSVSISTKNLNIRKFSSINTLNAGTGEGGILNLNVKENLSISGKNPFFFLLGSFINSFALNQGKSGDINISAKKLNIQDGGVILSQPFGISEGGDINIKTLDLLIDGAIPLNQEQNEFSPSLIATNSFISKKSGNININTKNLQLTDGGSILANTNGTSNGGNIFIDSRSVKIDGILNNIRPSQIASSADSPTPFFQSFFNLPDIPSGDSGSINIKTKDLSISDNGLISVINEGTGNAGNININANHIDLNRGNISAATLVVKGGNINLTAKDIALKNKSDISATSGGQGDGGNIFINSDSLLIKEQSQIAANAFEGRGGNILINTEVFLISNDSVITATSELGIDGVVEIQAPEQNLESVIVPIKAQILEFDPNVVQRCLNIEGEEELLILKPRDAVRSYGEDNPEPIEEPSLEMLNITENMTEEQKEFYHQHLPPNALVKTEEGIFAVNLCLQNFLAETNKYSP